MTAVTSVVLAGVGGQGTILAGKILTSGLMAAGYDVKMAEVHGMSQRGGSVSSQVRFGDAVASPIIGEGMADILVAFEEMEAARYAKFLKPDGIAVVNMHRIPSLPVLSGACTYPEGGVAALQQKIRVVQLEAAKIAARAGQVKSANMVLLGALIEVLGLLQIDWQASIAQTVKKEYAAVNIQAFEKGRQAAGKTTPPGEIRHISG